MSDYGQFCPVALGAEIFAERWTPLILRELLAGARRFADIQRGVPRMSRNLLTQRLVSLQRAGVIDRRARPDGRGHDYHLTEAGHELGGVIDALGTWGYKWASKDLTGEHLDPDFLMWALRRMVRVDALPDDRVVVLVRFRRDTKHRYWLVLKRPQVDLCLLDPGFDVDVELCAEPDALARVCLGHLQLVQAVKAGRIELAGASHLCRGVYSWLGVTRFAAAVRR
ncbi:MAG TPA: helix-turn-helix domain-containing protein [Gemmatimonadaceae bacterium]|nr:helix-turn-helix domain-containing protein [Gemmatimonadaceae bacterium]